jgi:hypothetical protein
MFPLFGFSIQEFFICYFYSQKKAFVCEFQHTPLWKLMIFSRFHTLYLLEKVVFLDPERSMSPLGKGEKNFFFNFECYDLTNDKE